MLPQSDVVAGGYQLAPTNEQNLDQAVTVNTKYADLTLGVTDSLNIVLAARHGTVRLLTLDERHFRVVRPLAHGAAFTLLPFDSED
jgi:predicted nucleic acid-binding protein